MPTNIINGSQGPAVGGNAFQSIGAGAQGLAALLGSAFAARSADQAAKNAANAALPEPTGFGPGSSFGPSSTPSSLSPQDPASVKPMDIPLTRTPWDQTQMQFGGGNGQPTVFSPTNWDPLTGSDPRDNPLANVRTRPIPGLLSNTFQYGGL